MQEQAYGRSWVVIAILVQEYSTCKIAFYHPKSGYQLNMYLLLLI